MEQHERHSHPHTHKHYSVGQLANHLRSWHEEDEDSVGSDEAHVHFSEVKIGDNYAARLDVHPWAMPRLKDAPVVFAVMEGCLKADAVLSAILREDLPASVYSFPSVTLGNCPEHERFSKDFLTNSTVIAVLDADWADPSKKGAVENQGRIYQARLLAMDVSRVHLCAPPQGTQKGVDDYLGVGGGHLSQLVCIDVEPPDYNVVESWVKEHGDTKQWDSTATAVHILRSMAVFSGVSKVLSVTLSCMGNVMGVDRSTIGKYLKRFEAWGAIEIDGNLDVGPSRYGGTDWIDRPTIRIIPEVLQATVLPERILGEVLGTSFFEEVSTI